MFELTLVWSPADLDAVVMGTATTATTTTLPRILILLDFELSFIIGNPSFDLAFVIGSHNRCNDVGIGV